MQCAVFGGTACGLYRAVKILTFLKHYDVDILVYTLLDIAKLIEEEFAIIITCFQQR